ncbi:MAG TPA: YdcH family protein [Candidatus Acidoferrales bacterium]|nr:YdcH family protein [Candidatus Acidoferrales bacterium]
MALTSQDIRQSLLANDPEFQKLAEEHSRCESQLDQILKSSYLNSEELMRETALKKRKLQLKDRMERILAQHQQALRL